MPFDAAGFPPRQPGPERPRPSDNMVTALIIIISVALLATPLSLAAFIDIVHYMRGP